MSGESTPLLSGAVPAFELLIAAWKDLAEIPHLAPLIEIGLTWADKYSGKMEQTMAYPIAMCQFGVPQ
jgi:hypothetical protein